MSQHYIDRPICQGCGKLIPYGQKYLHAVCNRVNGEISATDLTIQNIYEIFSEDPDLTDCELLGVYTSFGAADAAANGKGPGGVKGFIRVQKGVVYHGKAYILKHTVVSVVDVCFADIEKSKIQSALDKLSPEEKALLKLDSL